MAYNAELLPDATPPVMQPANNPLASLRPTGEIEDAQVVAPAEAPGRSEAASDIDWRSEVQRRLPSDMSSEAVHHVLEAVAALRSATPEERREAYENPNEDAKIPKGIVDAFNWSIDVAPLPVAQTSQATGVASSSTASPTQPDAAEPKMWNLDTAVAASSTGSGEGKWTFEKARPVTPTGQTTEAGSHAGTGGSGTPAPEEVIDFLGIAASAHGSEADERDAEQKYAAQKETWRWLLDMYFDNDDDPRRGVAYLSAVEALTPKNKADYDACLREYTRRVAEYKADLLKQVEGEVNPDTLQEAFYVLYRDNPAFGTPEASTAYSQALREAGGLVVPGLGHVEWRARRPGLWGNIKQGWTSGIQNSKAYRAGTVVADITKNAYQFAKNEMLKRHKLATVVGLGAAALQTAGIVYTASKAGNLSDAIMHIMHSHNIGGTAMPIDLNSVPDVSGHDAGSHGVGQGIPDVSGHETAGGSSGSPDTSTPPATTAPPSSTEATPPPQPEAPDPGATNDHPAIPEQHPDETVNLSQYHEGSRDGTVDGVMANYEDKLGLDLSAAEHNFLTHQLVVFNQDNYGMGDPNSLPVGQVIHLPNPAVIDDWLRQFAEQSADQSSS